MAYKDLREWIEIVRDFGELEVIEGADWNLEMGGIAEKMARVPKPKALLFDRIKDYPPGYRVITNILGSPRRLALTLGITPSDDKVAMLQTWRQKLKEVRPIPAREVSNGPVTENIRTGDDINILDFPVPHWNEGDGGRYIGTFCAIITRDPDEGWVNLGIARGMVQNGSAIGFTMVPDRHASIHVRKYWERGQAAPIAALYGQDPLIHSVSALTIPAGQSEYELAGGLRGEPVEVIRGELTGLPIPATAEIAVEAECIEGDVMPEGPHAEWHGYYPPRENDRPVIRIRRLYFRTNPIHTGYNSERPPSPNAFVMSLTKSAVTWDQMEAAGIPDIRGLWRHEVGGGSLLQVVSIKQRYPGHAYQAGLIMSHCAEGLRNSKYTVVVDEDINPADLEEVIWAILTRTDPERDIEISKRTLGFQDPAIPFAERRQRTGTKAIINACKPWEWMKEFMPRVEISPERMQELERKWGHLWAKKD